MLEFGPKLKTLSRHRNYNFDNRNSNSKLLFDNVFVVISCTRNCVDYETANVGDLSVLSLSHKQCMHVGQCTSRSERASDLDALNATSRHSVPNPRGEWQLNDRLAAQARHILSTAVGTTTREWQLSSLQATLPNCYNNCTGRRDQPKSTEVDEESDDSESVTEAPRPEKLKVLPPTKPRKSARRPRRPRARR